MLLMYTRYYKLTINIRLYITTVHTHHNPLPIYVPPALGHKSRCQCSRPALCYPLTLKPSDHRARRPVKAHPTIYRGGTDNKLLVIYYQMFFEYAVLYKPFQ